MLRTKKLLLPLDLRKRKFKYSSPMFVFNQHCLILFCFFLANKVIFSILFFPLLLQNTSSHTHTLPLSTIHNTANTTNNNNNNSYQSVFYFTFSPCLHALFNFAFASEKNFCYRNFLFFNFTIFSMVFS